MARIKHIALHTEDPAKTAAFYKEVFGLQELNRKPDDSGSEGVWLSDGYIYFAILKYGGDGAPNLGEGPSTVVGVHHIGFYVDDLEEACATIEAANSTECPGSSDANRKYMGPDGLMIDMRVRGWDEAIKASTQLYHLTRLSQINPMAGGLIPRNTGWPWYSVNLILLCTRIPHLAQTSDAVNRQRSCFSSRYMNPLAVFQI